MYEIITHTIYGNILQIQYIDEAGYFKSQIMCRKDIFREIKNLDIVFHKNRIIVSKCILEKQKSTIT